MNFLKKIGMIYCCGYFVSFEKNVNFGNFFLKKLFKISKCWMQDNLTLKNPNKLMFFYSGWTDFTFIFITKKNPLIHQKIQWSKKYWCILSLFHNSLSACIWQASYVITPLLLANKAAFLLRSHVLFPTTYWWTLHLFLIFPSWPEWAANMPFLVECLFLALSMKHCFPMGV